MAAMTSGTFSKIATQPIGLSSRRAAAALRESYAFQFILLLGAVLALKGRPVPTDNEAVYLLSLAKRWNPALLPNDWTFASGWLEHAVFNLVFGPITLALPIEAVAWIGRLLCWSAVLVAALEIGRHFEIPLWMRSLSIFLWTVFGKISGLSGEWVFGGFEAKCVAHALWLFSIGAFLRDQRRLGAALLGSSFTFHPSVGLWGGLAVAASLLAVGYRGFQLVRVGVWVIVFAAPGLLLSLAPLMLAEQPVANETWKYVATVHMPFHLDPWTWGNRRIASLCMLLAFVLLHARTQPAQKALRMSASIQAVLCLCFALGLACRAAEQYQWLKTVPFRLFPFYVPLFFFFHLMNAYRHRMTVRLGGWATAVGFAALLSIGNPLGEIADQVATWASDGQQEAKNALKWTRNNTPEGSVVMSPPWIKEAFYWSRRAQVANWNAIRTDRVQDWSDRIEALVGRIEANSEAAKIAAMRANYERLTEAEIGRLVCRYGVGYLVSRARYSYPVVFDSDDYRVYLLPACAPSGDR